MGAVIVTRLRPGLTAVRGHGGRYRAGRHRRYQLQVGSDPASTTALAMPRAQVRSDPASPRLSRRLRLRRRLQRVEPDFCAAAIYSDIPGASLIPSHPCRLRCSSRWFDSAGLSPICSAVISRVAHRSPLSTRCRLIRRLSHPPGRPTLCLSGVQLLTYSPAPRRRALRCAVPVRSSWKSFITRGSLGLSRPSSGPFLGAARPRRSSYNADWALSDAVVRCGEVQIQDCS